MSRLTTDQRENAYYNLLATYRQQVADRDYENYSTRIAGLRSNYNTLLLLQDCIVKDRNISGYAYTELSSIIEQICTEIDTILGTIEF